MPEGSDHHYLAPDPAGAQMAAARVEAHHGPSAQGERHGVALCLSGGGFRAALFHLGAVRRLNELSVLGQLRTVSAVSGGAILANLLADQRLAWPEEGEPGPVEGFEEYVAAPLRALTARNIRTPALLSRMVPARWGEDDASARELAQQLIASVPWWSMPLRSNTNREGPGILTCCTELAYGVSWAFADPVAQPPHGRMGDHRLGHAEPTAAVRVADAVAASCAYPPYISPLMLKGEDLGLEGGFRDLAERDDVRERIRRRVQLADGGIYDNLGLEPVWNDHAGLLVSDGGAVFQARTTGSLIGRLLHVLTVAAGGNQSTRLRWLHSAYKADVVAGSSWSSNALSPEGYEPEAVEAIRSIRTDLDAFTPIEQRILERHGYCVADAALRRHSPEMIVADAPWDPPHPDVAETVTVVRALAGSHRVRARGRVSSRGDGPRRRRIRHG